MAVPFSLVIMTTNVLAVLLQPGSRVYTSNDWSPHMNADLECAAEHNVRDLPSDRSDEV